MKLAFLTPGALALLPLALLPLLPARGPALPLSSLRPLAAVPRSWRERLCALQPGLCALTLLAVLLALTGPVLEERSRETVRRGVDLMLALDISASMGATDLVPNRISVAREAAAAFIERRRDDRVGVLLFSGTPYLLAPPALDKAPVSGRLRQVSAERAGGGTAIGDALAAAVARLKDSPAAERAVILLTDGTSNRGRVTPLAAARAAAALGVRIYTIGFGSAEGGEVPQAPGGGPVLLADGTPLRDILDEKELREIARLSGGHFFQADSEDTLAAVYRQIDALETTPLEVRERLAQTSLAGPLLRLAVLLAACELLLFRIWLRRVP